MDAGVITGQSPTTIYIVMEKMTWSLQTYLETRGPITDLCQLSLFVKGIVDGIHYLHVTMGILRSYSVSRLRIVV